MDVRLYLDEHVDPALASHLRRAGYDVLTTQEAGRAGQRVPDESQLELAASEGRALLSNDLDDYPVIDTEWKARGGEHAGIILCPRLPIAELCRRVEHHLRRFTAEEHHDLLLWC